MERGRAARTRDRAHGQGRAVGSDAVRSPWLSVAGLMGTIILFPIAFYFEPESFSGLADIPLSTFGWILFSALGSTVVGQGAMSFLLQRHPVSSVIPLSLVSPVIAVVASSLYFGTKLTSLMIIGGVIVMMGVAIVTIRTAKAKEAEQRS